MWLGATEGGAGYTVNFVVANAHRDVHALYGADLNSGNKPRTPMTHRAIQNAKDQSAKLLLMNPIAFRQLATIPIEESKETRTAATDGNTIFFNVSYAEGLSDKEIRGLLIHELLHILGEHGLRRGDFHPELWNIATDLVINGEIVRSDRFGKDFTLPKNIHFHKIYSSVAWRAEEVAHNLLQRGWKPPEKKRYEPPNDGLVCTPGGPWSCVLSWIFQKLSWMWTSQAI